MSTKIYDNIAQTIGSTPLVRIPNYSKKHNIKADLLLKLEFFNPLASVKDRIALAMIDELIDRGYEPDKTTLIEPTSGNTGIGLAFVAASKGFKLILTMPESMSIERRKLLKFLGAELYLTEPAKGMKGAIAKADELLAQIPNSVSPGQFINPANPEIHRNTTAQEILNDTAGDVDALISGVGTGGTITGVGEVIKAHNPNFKVFAVEPKDSPVLSGGEPAPHKIQGIGAGFVPEILNTDIIDEIIQVSNEQSFEKSRELAKLEGIAGGISSGAALAAASEVGQRNEFAGKKIVVIIPSFAERYLSTLLFEGIEA